MGALLKFVATLVLTLGLVVLVFWLIFWPSGDIWSWLSPTVAARFD